MFENSLFHLGLDYPLNPESYYTCVTFPAWRVCLVVEWCNIFEKIGTATWFGYLNLNEQVTSPKNPPRAIPPAISYLSNNDKMPTKIHRTQKSQDTGSLEPTPTPTPSRGGRQRVYTSKKKDNGTLTQTNDGTCFYSVSFSY